MTDEERAWRAEFMAAMRAKAAELVAAEPAECQPAALAMVDQVLADVAAMLKVASRER